MAERSDRTSLVYRLVYMSVRRMGEHATIFGQDVRNILDTARSFNRGAGISGALLFNGSFFAQVLEGNQATILSLMTRIARDHRHSHVTVVEEGWVLERSFAAWAMAFADDTMQRVLAIPPAFDPENLHRISTSAEIIEAMQHLIDDEPDGNDPGPFGG